VQVVVGQRLCGAHKASRAVGDHSPLGRICSSHPRKDIAGAAGMLMVRLLCRLRRGLRLKDGPGSQEQLPSVSG
jgi:hypothetical protein